MDIHFIFIKYRMLCAAFIQRFVDYRHLSSLCGSRMQSWRALRHTSPADGNQRRTVPACNWQPVISLILLPVIRCSSVNVDNQNRRRMLYQLNRVQICSKGQRRERPAGKGFQASLPSA